MIFIWAGVCFLLTSTLLNRRWFGSWLAPGSFAGGFWLVFLVIPLLGGKDFRYSVSGIWTLVLLVFSVQVGAILSLSIQRRERGASENSDGPRNISPHLLKRIRFLMLLGSFLGLVAGVYWGRESFTRYGLGLDLRSFLTLGNFLSRARYSGEPPPPLVRLLLPWAYSAALFGGMYFAFAKFRKAKIEAFLPLFSLFLLSLLVAARAGMFIGLTLWFSGLAAMSVYRTRGRLRIWSARTVFRTASAIGLFVLFSVGVARLRLGPDSPISEGGWRKLRVGFFGYVSAFDNWAKPVQTHELSFGQRTFAGVADQLGLGERVQGIYSPTQVGGGMQTNIHTAFRGLIEDFSLLGAIAFCMALGMLGGVGYHLVLRGRTSGIPLFASYLVFLIYSPVISIMIYNSVVFSMFLLVLVVCFPAISFGKNENHDCPSRQPGVLPVPR